MRSAEEGRITTEPDAQEDVARILLRQSQWQYRVKTAVRTPTLMSANDDGAPNALQRPSEVNVATRRIACAIAATPASAPAQRLSASRKTGASDPATMFALQITRSTTG